MSETSKTCETSATREDKTFGQTRFSRTSHESQANDEIRATIKRTETIRGGPHMKYMLLIYGDENGLSESERKDCYVESTQLAHQLHSNGQYVAANPLHPTAMATSVRVRDNKRLVTDGPFAETREQLGGYFLIEANTLDEAIAVAAKIPMARKGTVEVRPVIEIPNLP